MDVPMGGVEGGGAAPMSANFKKVGYAAGTLALIKKFDQISTYSSIISLIMVGRSQLSLLQYTLFL